MEAINANDFSKLNFTANMLLPKQLESRTKRSSEKDTLVIDGEISLSLNGSLDFKFNIVNNIKDHRLRILINPDIYSDKFVTDTPFGFIERKIGVDSKYDNWRENYVEYPVDIFPIINTAYLNTNDKQVIINTKGIKEIQGINNNNKTTLALTLYKSHGHLGKDNLNWRPNRASGINNKVVLTPDAQLYNMNLEFEFSINLNSEIKNEKQILIDRKKYITLTDFYHYQQLNTFENRLERFQVPMENFEVQNSMSILELDDNLIYSSITPIYDEKGFDVRFYSVSEDKISLNIDGNNFINLKGIKKTNEQYIKKYQFKTTRIK